MFISFPFLSHRVPLLSIETCSLPSRNKHTKKPTSCLLLLYHSDLCLSSHSCSNQGLPCNLEKMPITSVDEWPQLLHQYHHHRHRHHHHHRRPSSNTSSSDSAMPVTTTVAADTAATTTTTKFMEKPHQEQQKQQEALRCPRCESSNTKFCYYNNYSLSQPRHFCKACKRYWTRGGTLRNVPVGGGCRKNKRVKRHVSTETLQPRSAAADIIATTTNTTTAATSTATTVGTNNIPPIYNFAASGPHLTGLSDFATSSAGLDLPPMLNSLWLNFPASTPEHHYLADYTSQNSNHIQADTLNSSDHPYSLLNSSTSSLLTTTLHQQKLMMGLRDQSRPSSDFHLLFPMGDLHQSTPITNVSSSLFKGVKMDHDQEGLSMTIPCNTNNETMAASDVSTYWGAANPGRVATNWSEATSYGSSITPLI